MPIELGDGNRIELVRGDITCESIDAIVNAANGGLAPGGGVCGAIHRAGGPEIARECARIVARRGSLAAGEVAITTGGDLPARRVVHAVGPIWQGGTQGEPEALARCYRGAIRAADAEGLNGIAFPSISTGIYGYPVHLAAPVALAAAREALAVAGTLTTVRFVLFDDATLAAYQDAADSAGT